MASSLSWREVLIERNGLMMVLQYRTLYLWKQLFPHSEYRYTESNSRTIVLPAARM